MKSPHQRSLTSYREEKHLHHVGVFYFQVSIAFRILLSPCVSSLSSHEVSRDTSYAGKNFCRLLAFFGFLVFVPDFCLLADSLGLEDVSSSIEYL
jgi:hypothetical protein